MPPPLTPYDIKFPLLEKGLEVIEAVNTMRSVGQEMSAPHSVNPSVPFFFAHYLSIY